MSRSLCLAGVCPSAEHPCGFSPFSLEEAALPADGVPSFQARSWLRRSRTSGWEPKLPPSPCSQVPAAPEPEQFCRTNQYVFPARGGPRLCCWLLLNLFSQISNVLAELCSEASQISDA